MKSLSLAFLKIFFRNRRAMYFVLLMPAVVFLIVGLLGLEQVIRFDVPGISYLNFLLAGMMAFALMQSGIYTVAYNLVEFRKSGVLKRLFVTPLTVRQFLLSQTWARFLIALVQAILLILLGLIVFGIKVDFQIIWLPVLIFIGSSLFLQFGVLIAALARDYEEAAPYTNVVGLTLTFLGDVFFPTDNLPTLLARVAEWLPLKPYSQLLRFSLFGQMPESFGQPILVLLLWWVGLTIAAWVVFRKTVLK